MKTPRVKPTKRDETNDKNTVFGCFHGADTGNYCPLSTTIACLNDEPAWQSGSWSPLITCWIAGLPGVCYMREWTARGAEQLPTPHPYKLVPSFTFQAEEFQELGEAQMIGNVPLWPPWRKKEKKIVIKHFVDPLTPHQILAGGGRWNRSNRACNCNVPCERQRSWWVYPHRASDLLCFDVTMAPRA